VRRIGLLLSLLLSASVMASTAMTAAGATVTVARPQAKKASNQAAIDRLTKSLSSTAKPAKNGPDWKGESNQRVAWYGYEVGPAGDVNGDGYDDAVVGAYRYDANTKVDSGKAWLYYGSPTGLSTTAGWTVDGPWPGAMLGHSVSTAGDINGDGYDDIVIGVPSPTGGTGSGWAYAYYGSPTGPSATPDWAVSVTQAADWFGRTVRTAGDVNGDGYDDVIVGAPHYDDGQMEEGGVWAYYGSPTGLHTTADWAVEENQAWALFGRWNGTAGDVNGDGYDDVIVGAHFWDDNFQNEGRAFAFYGSANGLHKVADWYADGGQKEAWFGRAGGTAGDVNADGYSDVVVGAPKYDNDQTNEGRAFAFYGSATGLHTVADWYAEADQAEAWYGRRVTTARDVNGDGYDDVLIAAPNYDTIRPDGGKVFLYYGSATGLMADPAWTQVSNQDHAWFGRSVARAGDVNGDGYADVIIGAPLYDNPEHDEGMAFAFYGSPGGL
jgi:hypothetical protein